MPILRAPRSHRRGRDAVHILHFLRRRVSVAKSGIHADVWRYADQFAEFCELIRTKIVGLHRVPGVVRGVVASETPESRLDLLDERNGVGAEAVDVVGRHERDRSDEQTARTGSCDLEGYIAGIGLRCERERELFVFGGNRTHRNRLPVACARTPHQRNLHPDAGAAAQIDAARVLFALYKRETRLPDAMRSSWVERDLRALVADKRMILVHRDNLIGTNRLPSASLHAGKASTTPPAGCFSFLRGDREVKLAVIEHFGPETAVHGFGNVLDKHSKHII